MMEPHATLAIWDGDKLTLHIGLPNGSTISGAVTNLPAMEHEDV